MSSGRREAYWRFIGSASRLVAAILFPMVGMSGDTQVGIWVAEKNFSQVNMACIRIWTCHPKESVMHSSDTFVAVTRPQAVTGVCTAAGGPVDSCNVCASSPPKEACKWELRKRH